MFNEVVLTESRTLRASYTDRTDVLGKVKALSLLPGDTYATTEMVASYYEVGIEAIKWHMRVNKEELESNGYRVLKGTELAELKDQLRGSAPLSPLISKNTRSLGMFDRRAILNIGQMLVESPVARQVRTYLLDIEETATLKQKIKVLSARNAFLEDELETERMTTDSEHLRNRQHFLDGVKAGRANPDVAYGLTRHLRQWEQDEA